MEELVREYDNIYNGFLDALNEVSKMKDSGPTNREENSLLERISRLEIERGEKADKFEKIKEDHKNLQLRLQGMEKLKKEYENVNQKVEETSMIRQESLNREVTVLKRELDMLKNQNQRVEKENQRLVENMAKSEIDFTRAEKERKDEKEKLESQQKGMEDMVSEYQIKVKQVETELLERRNELNKLKSKGNSYHKNYNMMKQLYKTNEAKVRSLEGEIRKLKGDMTKKQVKIGKAIEAMETLAGELRRKGTKRRGISELLGSVCELIDLDDIYDEELSIDTEEEMKWGVNENLRGVQQEFDEKSIIGMEEEFEKDLQGFNTLDSDVFHNKEYSEGPKIEGYHFKEDSGDGIFKRNEDSQLTEAKSRKLSEMRETEKSRQEYRSQLEEEIQDNVLKRMRPSRSFHEKGEASGRKERPSEDKGRKSSTSGNKEAYEEFKSKIYGKCRGLDSEIFEVVEKEQIEMRLKMFRTISDFVGWLMDYLEEKVRKMKGEYNVLFSEKSKSFPFINCRNC